jgi:hypothetical protein
MKNLKHFCKETAAYQQQQQQQQQEQTRNRML